MLAVLVLVAAGVATASYLVRPDRARSFDLFYGSLFLDDERAPVAVDLTNGRPTVRLVDAAKQVSAADPRDLTVVPLSGGTLLLNRTTGEFNVVDATGLVVKTEGGGVPLPKATGATTAAGVAAGANAYVVRTGADGTSVFLVGQATVQQATGAGAKVTPRASAAMPEQAATTPGAATSDGADLWLLVGPPGGQTVRQLRVPRGSDAGATLDVTDHGTVTGPAALAHATRGADGAGGQVVAVASPARLDLYSDGRSMRSVPLGGLDDADRVLPATNQDGRFRFLFHTPAGWRLVSVGADGGRLDGPVPVSGIDPATALATPAASRGGLYTMDLGTSGRLWRIGDDGAATSVSGTADGPVGYPTALGADGRELEAAAFGDARVFARGARVVFNSPNHVRALAVFTDDTRAPVVVDKSAATDLNAAGGAAALAERRRQNERQDPRTSKPKKAPQQATPVNNAIDCKTVKQVPHIPVITQATPGSRSVQLLWTYPLLDTQDCAPSTYVVDVRLLSANAPSPPASLTVQGQNGVTISKLFPSTRYQLTVTAFINGQGTPSKPVEITTGPEGPAAPTDVRADVDSAGNWVVSWSSCGGVREGCVPSSSWNVVPQLCDGLPGLSSPPAVQSVAGDPTQHSFRTVYPGSSALLGHGLSFQVIGIGEQGTVGTPGSGGGCAYSWSPPVASQLSLVSSLPSRTTQGGAATSATLSLRISGDPVRAVGGIGAQYTYSLLSGGEVVSSSGPTTKTVVSLPGVRPGRTYTASVSVSPPRHPEAAATVGPVPVDAAQSDWPALAASASFANDNLLSGTLTVRISGVSSDSANGETFALRNSGLSCGPNNRYDLDNGSFDPAAGALTFSGVSRVSFHGDCTVTVQLQENGNPPLYFGGVPSPGATAGVSIDAPSLGSSGGDFRATWVQQRKPAVAVSYKGGNPVLVGLSGNWQISLTSGALACGTTNDKPTTTIDVTGKDCRSAAGSGAAFSVSVSFRYFGKDYSFDGIAVSGDAPQPVDPTKMSFTAAWDSSSPRIDITYSGPYDDATLAALDWSEAVSNDGATTCQSATATMTRDGVTVPADRCLPGSLPSGSPSWSPAPPTYTVDITFTDPNYGTTNTYTVTVSGTPPA